MRASIHTHTKFCDGRDDVETMCRAAFEKGLDAIGFSSHASTGKSGLQTSWNIKHECVSEYIDEVLAARNRWEGKIKVFLGFEVDYISGLRSARDEDMTSFVRDGTVDYLIGSVHYIVPPGGSPWDGLSAADGSMEEIQKIVQAAFGGSGEALMNAYWDAVLEMVNTGGFDIVGHLDLVKKSNGKAGWFNEQSREYLQRAEDAAIAIARSGLVAEVNTGGMNRGYLSETFPSLSILRFLCRYKVPVMISADAHRCEHLDGHYEDARRFLREAGFSSHVVFSGRSGGKPNWYEESL